MPEASPTGEVVPMLQVAPSKTGAERLLVSPELADVLTAIIFRVRAGNPARPLLCAYDVFEQTRSPPMPFLFQRLRQREPARRPQLHPRVHGRDLAGRTDSPDRRQREHPGASAIVT